MSTSSSIPEVYSTNVHGTISLWYLSKTVRCTNSSLNLTSPHKDEIELAKRLIKEGDNISSFRITHGAKKILYVVEFAVVKTVTVNV